MQPWDEYLQREYKTDEDVQRRPQFSPLSKETIKIRTFPNFVIRERVSVEILRDDR